MNPTHEDVGIYQAIVTKDTAQQNNVTDYEDIDCEFCKSGVYIVAVSRITYLTIFGKDLDSNNDGADDKQGNKL